MQKNGKGAKGSDLNRYSKQMNLYSAQCQPLAESEALG